MSAEAVGWVYRHSPYSGAAFAVHLAIADTVNDQHGQRFYMSASTLARKARCSRTTASEMADRLCRDGYLARIGGGQLAGKPVEFRFLFPDVAVQYESRGGVPKSNTPPVASDDTGVPTADTGVSRETTQTQETTQPQPKRARRKRRTPPPEDFAANETHRALAAERGLDPDAEVIAWIDKCAANGYQYADHAAAFRNWLRDGGAAKYTGKPARPTMVVAPFAEPPSGPSFVADPDQLRRVDRADWHCTLDVEGCEGGFIDRRNPDGSLIDSVACRCRGVKAVSA